MCSFPVLYPLCSILKISICQSITSRRHNIGHPYWYLLKRTGLALSLLLVGCFLAKWVRYVILHIAAFAEFSQGALPMLATSSVSSLGDMLQYEFVARFTLGGVTDLALHLLCIHLLCSIETYKITLLQEQHIVVDEREEDRPHND